MKLIDAYILASTKRKTRRIRTALVVIVSSLLFAVLFFAALTAAGFRNAIDQVKDVGFNGRNITSVVSQQNASFGGEKEYNQLISEMNNELRAKGATVPAEEDRDQGFNQELFRRMNVLQIEFQNSRTAQLEEQIRGLGKPSAIYHFSAIQGASNNLVLQPDATKDPFVEKMVQESNNGGRDTADEARNTIEFFSVEKDMMRTQLQPGQTFDWQPGKPYPLLVSYAYLEKLSGKSFARVSTSEKNKAYRKLMAEFSGQQIAYCYRNGAAQAQVQDVIKYNKQVTTDKDAATKPIDLPVCADFDQALLTKLQIITKPDTAVKYQFPLATEPAPLTTPLQFKIVGYVPASAPYGTSDPITEVLTSIGSLPTGSYPGIVPSEVVSQDAKLSGSGASTEFMSAPPSLYADFGTRAEQRAFMDKTCAGNECAQGVKPYIQPFGNIGLAFSGVIKNATKVVLIVVLVITVIAGLMIMFTISKVIADSTKEIAVFRALGARRRDIAQIYFTYGGMLTATSGILALMLASLASVLISHMYAEKVAAGLIAGSGAYNESVDVVLWGLEPVWLVAIITALAAASIIGITIPVLANVRRSLVAAMREE